jgi:hypothetical protein
VAGTPPRRSRDEASPRTLERIVVGCGQRAAGCACERLRRAHERANDFGHGAEIETAEIREHVGRAVQSPSQAVRLDFDPRGGGADEQQLGLHAREQDGLRKHVDERTHHREARRCGDLVRWQPLAEIPAWLQARARQVIELARVQRGHTGVRNRRRLERDQVVRVLGAHLQMLASIVEVHPDARVAQHIVGRVAEVVGMLEDMPREVRDVDAVNGWMQRQRVGGVADAESDHERARLVRHGEHGNVRQRSHVPLIEQRRRRHRVTIRDQPAAAAGDLRDRDDARHALTDRQEPLARCQRRQRTSKQLARR